MSRRVPPPCWTPDETLALLEAYKDRWFAVGRGNLRASDWDTVADVLSASPASASSGPKSPLQCRHKIEKLRKRYRMEKSRCLSFPGKFFSSWDLFPLLDSMGIGFPSTSGLGFNQDCDKNDDFGSGFLGKKFKDRNLGFRTKSYGNFESKIDMDDDFGVKVVDEDFKANTDLYRNLGSGFGVQMKSNRDFVPHGVRIKNYREEIDDDCRPNGNFDYYIGGGVDIVGGFPVKSLGDRSLVPPGFKPKNYGKIDGRFNSSFDYGIDKGSGISSKISSDWESVPLGFRSKNYAGMNGNLKPNVDCRVLNRNSSSLGKGFERKIGGGGVKRGRDTVEKMVSSINEFAEGFVKMEMMKMEMARDIEKMRMRMELKRNEMILESQQQIVDAFAKAISEKNKKKKVKVVSPTANGIGEEADRDNA